MTRNVKLFLFSQSILLLMLVQLGTDIYLPSVPAICDALQANETWVKLSLTAMIVMLGFSQLLYGPISDCYGRKPVMLFGLIIFVLGSLLLIAPQSASVLIIGRIIQGLGLGFGLSISSSIACDLYEGKNLHKALSIISVIYALMPIIAPVLGGALQTYFGWQASFYFLMIAGLCMLCMMQFCFIETNPYTGLKGFHTNELIKTYLLFLKNKIYTCNLIIATLFYTGEVSYIIQMPLIAQQSFGMSPMHTGWLVMFTSAAIIVGSALSSILINRISTNRLIFLGVCCALLGAILSSVFVYLGHYTLKTLIVPMVIFMLGSGFAFPNCISNCLELFPDKAGAASSLAIGLLTLLGGGLTVIIARLPSNNNSDLALFITFLAVFMMLVSFFLSGITRREGG